jgi:hypothetical protein
MGMEVHVPRNRRVWLLVAIVGLVSTAAALISLGSRSEASNPATMAALAPPGVVVEADIPAGIVPLYHGAVANADVFAATPCFCGCMEMLDHRHLLDCFQRPDGSGWEAHALGCAVCLGEARQVLDLLSAGADPDEVVAAVIAEWSDPYLIEE